MRGRASLLIIITLAALSLSQVAKTSAATTFNDPRALEQIRGTDLLPSALQASNGNLWIAWQSNQNSWPVPRYDILYKIRSAGVWSPTTNLTTTGWNAAPALAQLKNGTIMLFWANNQTGNYDLYYGRSNNAVWSSTVQLTTSTSDDTLPSATVAADGSLWLVWTRITTACGSGVCSTDQQLYYRTLKSGVWSGDVKLTTDTAFNSGPSIMVAKDGRVWVVWSKWAGTVPQIYGKIYNGTTWTPDFSLVTSSLLDNRPSLIQDRNGTLWLFWARDVQVTTSTFEYDVFNKQSYNNGLTWSGEVRMTFDPSGYLIDDKMPAAVQASDKSIWMFYVSDLTGLGQDFDIYFMTSSPIYPIHDVAVKSIRASPQFVYSGQTMSIRVTVSNLGDFFETIQLSVQTVGPTTFTVGSVSASLPSGTWITLLFSWSPNSAPLGLYTIVAWVPPVNGETIGNSGDNTLSYSFIAVLPPDEPGACFKLHLCPL
jgi:hypothetical protein